MPAARPLELICLRPDAGPAAASTAVVAVVASAQWVPPAEAVAAPDPTFVTQLIADAERLAERRRWPRDRAADALSAYGAHQHHVWGAGKTTRQTIWW